MAIERITVVGLGLLGGSLCRALRQDPSAPYVVGYAHREETLVRAREMRLADEVTSDLVEAVRGADLVVLSTPVSVFEGALRQMAPGLKAGAVVTDVGSTKRTICRVAREVLPKEVHFVGGHPMAGGERTGAEFSRADLFRDAVVIVTPEMDTDDAALAVVEAMWAGLGARVARTSPEAHDRLVASVSHLPHLTAAMLVSVQSPATLEMAGPGYRDTTRVAAGDPEMWRDILIDNRDHVAEALRRLKSEAEELIGLLEKGDATGIREYLAGAAIKRGSPIRERTPMV